MVGFIGNVESFHSKESVKLHLKNGGEDGTSLIPFSELVNSVTELKNGSTFYVKPWLFTGDLQTMYFAAADFSKTFQVYYGRRLITLPDGGTVTADFSIPAPDSEKEFNELAEKHLPEDWPKQHPRTRFLTPEEIISQGSDDEKPLVVICHGLGGGSHEPVIRSLVEKLNKVDGFEAVVLNSRGCSRSKLSTPELFNGLATDDLRNFVKLLKEIYPNRPLYAVGFSFGATILANYLGEEAENTVFTAAALLSNPWDMVDSSYRFPSRFLSRFLFQQAATQFLVRLIKSNRKAMSENPLVTEETINHKYTSIADFDNRLTAPLYGFPTAFAYYRAASSVNRIMKIHTPLLAINSHDDPMVGVNSIPIHEAQINPYIVQLRTDIGGHLAYVQSDGDSWATKRIAEYFKLFHDMVDATKKPETEYQVPVSKYDYKLHY